ncbi:hypothetical protein YC2023_073649 [Brassica napus]
MSSTQIKEKRWASYPNSSKWADTGLTIFHLVKTQLPFRPKVFHRSSSSASFLNLSFAAGLRRLQVRENLLDCSRTLEAFLAVLTFSWEIYLISRDI